MEGFASYNLCQVHSPISSEVLARLIAGNEMASCILCPDGSSRNSVRWYRHEEILCQWSAYFPYTVFKLNGCEEDSNDVWEKYFYRGRLAHYLKPQVSASVDTNELRKRWDAHLLEHGLA